MAVLELSDRAVARCLVTLLNGQGTEDPTLAVPGNESDTVYRTVGIALPAGASLTLATLAVALKIGKRTHLEAKPFAPFFDVRADSGFPPAVRDEMLRRGELVRAIMRATLKRAQIVAARTADATFPGEFEPEVPYFVIGQSRTGMAIGARAVSIET
jgi:hypothetical protein